jgi:hypothetical protein
VARRIAATDGCGSARSCRETTGTSVSAGARGGRPCRCHRTAPPGRCRRSTSH